MHSLNGGSPYRHAGVALLRAAAVPLHAGPAWWPSPTDVRSCRVWLNEVWRLPGFATAVRQASPILADRVEAVVEDQVMADKRVRRAALATARYLMRATGRPTPFGLFAGVAAVSLDPAPAVRWGHRHRAAARVDTQWLADVIDQMETCPDVLEHLTVVFNNLAVPRGDRLEAPYGPDRVSVRATGAIRAAREALTAPTRFGALADTIAETFGADPAMARTLLTGLVRQGLLITCLRAPHTVVDPLGHLIEQLRAAHADTVAALRPWYQTLSALHQNLHHHNEHAAPERQPALRVVILHRMATLSRVGRTPLAVDLRLDCDVRLPPTIVRDMEQAAGVLLRLTRRPEGGAAWAAFHAAFCDRYGTGTLVAVTDVVDPDTGLGYPAGYPGSVVPAPGEGPGERDERLLALAWQAVSSGGEVVLTDATVAALTDGDQFDQRYIPPHVEIAARIHATSIEALLDDDYSLTLSPARSAGTLTSRFTPIAEGCGLDTVYRDVPTTVAGAVPVQLSIPPVYPHSENVGRIPAYLPLVLSLGEHRGPDEDTITLDDLALTASAERLYLISLSRRQVIEPQVFHALALEKQLPPIGRFLAHLPRAFTARWHEFDWGPHAHRMPYLPRVRYGRTVLAPARWRLTSNDLPPGDASSGPWQQAINRWRLRWRCPDTVELRDADRTLRLSFTEPIHVAVLHAHLQRHGDATLIEAAPAEAFGWSHGHVHEVAVPLAIDQPRAPGPRIDGAPVITNTTHGHLPGSPDTAWLYAKIHTHPERFDDVLTEHLGELFTSMGQQAYWFVRYRSLTETDHLRLRIRMHRSADVGTVTGAVGGWMQQMRRRGIAGRVTFDTYYPEVGRYGHGPAMHAAEAVFGADSRAVVAVLRHRATIDPIVATAVGMVDIAHGFLGHRAEAMRWLTARPASPGTSADRASTGQVTALVGHGALPDLDKWPADITNAARDRATALAAYRAALPPETDVDAIVESLLHMHHNRVLGINPDGEAACRRLARQAAHTWLARPGNRP